MKSCDQKIDLSIIIVSWNAKNLLRKCLKSIFVQHFTRSFEVIVVDNDSSDGSIEMVGFEFPQVVLIDNPKNYGFSKANNIGAKSSRGRFLAFINSDVVLIDGCLERMINFMERHPEVGISGPKILNHDYSFQDSCRKFPSLWNSFCEAVLLHKFFPKWSLFSGEKIGAFFHNDIKKVQWLVGAFWMVRRCAVERIGLLDERFFIYSEDIDWCKRFWNGGWEVVFNPEASVIHYDGGSSANDPVRFSQEQLRARFQYWVKYHRRPTVLIFCMILLLHHGLRAAGEVCRAVMVKTVKQNETSRIETRFRGFRAAWKMTMGFWGGRQDFKQS